VRKRYAVNSCRVTWRGEPVRWENWMLGVGVTVRVRDTITRLESNR
jgi:hypothetical protein